jgi:hypothetical protein
MDDFLIAVLLGNKMLAMAAEARKAQQPYRQFLWLAANYINKAQGALGKEPDHTRLGMLFDMGAFYSVVDTSTTLETFIRQLTLLSQRMSTEKYDEPRVIKVFDAQTFC